MGQGTSSPWIQRALVAFAVAVTLSPLAAAGARAYGPGSHNLNDLFEFLIMCWFVELAAAFIGAPLIGRIKDARKREGATAPRARLLIARLAFWTALVLCVALPCAIAWVFVMGFAMSS